MCGVFAPKTFGTRGFRPAAPRPRGARGHPPGLSRTQDWGSGSTPHLGGLRGGGTQRRAEHLQNKGSGPALIWKRPPPPPPPALARPALTHLVLETHPGSRVLAPRTLTNPEEPLETTHPAARGGGRGVPGIPVSLPHQTRHSGPLRITILLLFFKQPELSF